MLVLPERRSITLIFRLFLTVGSPLRHAGQMRFLFDRIAFMVMGIFFILSPYSSVSSTTGISFPAGPLTLTPTGTNVSCYGLNNGKIVSTTTGGAGGAINFTLIPGALTNTTGIFDNLSAGVYVVKADDGTSNATASVTITEPPVSTVPSLTLTSFPTYCPGVTSFSLSYSASNANPVSYSISTGTPALPGFVPVVDAPLGTSPIAVPLPAGVSKGTYQFRLSLKNASGCTAATQTLIMNFDDSTAPVWASFPADVSIECGTDSSPVTTGTPTATDNCGSVVVSYTDNVIPGNCPGRSTISRSWKATDQSGNQITRTQSIIINDTTPPVINCTSFTVTNPSDIPAANLNTGITATDNCGTTTIELVSENYIGLNGSAGFCPSSVERTYRAMDQCGNYSSVCKQVITVQSAGTCKVCEDDVPFFPVIFSKALLSYLHI